ncbi:MAG: cupredoxin domain-containing protein, partial [Nanoarchaeota archaeon]
MNKNTIFGLIAVGILIFGGYYFFNSKQQVQVPQEETNTENKQVEIVEARKIVVEGDEFKFTPTSITVKKGEKIMLTFKNVGKFPHNLKVDELGISTKTINGGEEDSIEFVSEK